MERSRQSTMQWRFSVDPHEDPIWSQLPRPDDLVVVDDMEGDLRDKYWANKMKFQTGQFTPPPVKPKPRGRSRSDGDTNLPGGQGLPEQLRTEDVLGSASLSPVKEMRRKLAAGEFKTSTPIAKQPMELESGYITKLRDIHQRLADEAEMSAISGREAPSYISREELDSMNERKKNFSEELFTEKSEEPKLPREKPKLQRKRSDMELHNLLASRKETADVSAIEKEGEVASTAAVVSKPFSKLNASEELEAERQRYEERQEIEKKKKEEEAKKKEREREREKEMEQERMKQEEEERRERAEKQEEERQQQQKMKEESPPKRTR